MKKRTYNMVCFILIPLIITMVCICTGVIAHFGIWSNTLKEDLVTEESLQCELWSVIKISDVETAYIVYGTDNWDISDDEYLIAIQGWSVEKIDDKVEECYPGAYRTSYLRNKEDYRLMDITCFEEVKDYLKFEGYKFESDDAKADYINEVSYKLKSVRVYDISDYIGYKENYNNGKGLAEVIVLMVISIIGIITIIFELIITFIIKILINKKLK